MDLQSLVSPSIAEDNRCTLAFPCSKELKADIFLIHLLLLVDKTMYCLNLLRPSYAS